MLSGNSRDTLLGECYIELLYTYSVGVARAVMGMRDAGCVEVAAIVNFVGCVRKIIHILFGVSVIVGFLIVCDVFILVVLRVVGGFALYCCYFGVSFVMFTRINGCCSLIRLFVWRVIEIVI
eukprot:gene2860-1845_t